MSHESRRKYSGWRVGIWVVCLLLICACGAPEASEDARQADVFRLDVDAVGERLYHELVYRDQLEALTPTLVYVLFGIDENDVMEQKNFFSSGATAEEVIVFQAAGSAALAALTLAVEARINDQKEIYASYAPEEILYLDGAVLREKGDYLIYCVAADPVAAASLVDEILGNP